MRKFRQLAARYTQLWPEEERYIFLVICRDHPHVLWAWPLTVAALLVWLLT
jgi:hypothetical protein